MKNCSCPECISACNNDPGRLVPADIQKIADHLEISRETLIEEYLVKIPLMGKDIYALAPAKLKGKHRVARPGTVVPDYYTKQKGKCIFLDKENMCGIHSVKPFECAAYMGCKNTFLGKMYREREVEEYFFSRWKHAKIK